MRDEKLVAAAAALARAAPTQWREFLSAFQQHAEGRKDECVQAPIEALSVAQGRAQQAASLFVLFGEVVKNADRISDRKERRSKSNWME